MSDNTAGKGVNPSKAPVFLDPFKEQNVDPTLTTLHRKRTVVTADAATRFFRGASPENRYISELAASLAGTNTKFEITKGRAGALEGVTAVQGSTRVALPIEVAPGIWQKGGAKYAFAKEVFGAESEGLTPGRAIARRIREMDVSGEVLDPTVRIKGLKTAVESTMTMASQHVSLGPRSSAGPIFQFLSTSYSYGDTHPIFGAFQRLAESTRGTVRADETFIQKAVAIAAGDKVPANIRASGKTAVSRWHEHLRQSAETLLSAMMETRGLEGGEAAQGVLFERHAFMQGLKQLKVTAGGPFSEEIDRYALEQGEATGRVVMGTTTPDTFTHSIFPDYNKSMHHLRQQMILSENRLLKAAALDVTSSLEEAEYQKLLGTDPRYIEELERRRRYAELRAHKKQLREIARLRVKSQGDNARFYDETQLKGLQAEGRLRGTGVATRTAWASEADKAVEIHAERMALGQERGKMGRLVTGVDMKILSLRPKEGLQGEALRRAHQAFRAFGDTAAIAGSRFSVELFGMNQGFREHIIDFSEGAPGFSRGSMNPILRDLVEATNEGILDSADPRWHAILQKYGAKELNAEALESAADDILRPYDDAMSKLRSADETSKFAPLRNYGGRRGFLSFGATSLGRVKYDYVDEFGKPVTDKRRAVARVPRMFHLGEDEEVVGIQVTNNKARLVTKRTGVDRTRQATSAVVAEQQRLGLHHVDLSTNVPAELQADLITMRVGDGVFTTERGETRLTTAVHRAYEAGGERGVRILRESLEEAGVSGLESGVRDGTPFINVGRKVWKPGDSEYIDEGKLTGILDTTAQKLGFTPLAGPDGKPLIKQHGAFHAMMSKHAEVPDHIAETVAKFLNDQLDGPKWTGQLVKESFDADELWTTVMGRANQPVMGQVGAVRVRLEDLKGFTSTTARYGVKDSPSVSKWLNTFREKVNRPTAGWRSYQAAIYDAIEGRSVRSGLITQADTATGVVPGQYSRMTLSEFRESYSQKQIARTGQISIQDFANTPWTEKDPVTGELRWTKTATRVDVTQADIEALKLTGNETGILPYSPDPKAKGARIGSFIISSGEQLEQQLDEVVRLQDPHQKTAIELYEQVMSGRNLDSMYRAGATSSLAMKARTLGKKGAYHTKVYQAERSMTANIGTASGINAGEVGVTVSDLRSMNYTAEEVATAAVAKKGGRPSLNAYREILRTYKDEIEADPTIKQRVRDIFTQKKTQKMDLFMALKTEPARDPWHFSAHRVKLIPQGAATIYGSDGKPTNVVDRRGVLALNSIEMDIINRDKDYDMLMSMSLAERGNVREMVEEQEALREIWEAKARDNRAMTDLEQLMGDAELQEWNQEVAHLRSEGKSRWTTDIDNYVRKAKVDSHQALQIANRLRLGEGGAQQVEAAIAMARAQGTVQGVGEFTGLANVRWRQSAEIAMDIMSGRKAEELYFRNQRALQDQVVQEALGIVRENDEGLATLMEIQKASEYAVLKKGALAKMFGLEGGDTVHMADPFLHAMYAASSRAELGNEEAVRGLADAFLETLGGAQGKPLHLAAARAGASYEDIRASSDRLYRGVANEQVGVLYDAAMKAAKTAQAMAYLQYGLVDGEQVGLESASEVFRRMTTSDYRTDTGFFKTAVHFLGRMLGVTEELPTPYPGDPTAGSGSPMPRGGPRAGHEHMGGMTKTVAEIADAGERAYRKLTEHQAGRIALGLGAVGVAGSLISNLFSSDDPSPGEMSPQGAPMPPTALLEGPGDAQLDFALMEEPSPAYVDRTPGVRTHLRVSAQNPGNDFGFMHMADETFGTLGIQPRQTGRVFADNTQPMHRHEVEREIENRMRSSF